MDTIIIAVTMSLTAITSLYWGSVLSIRLPEIDKRWDRKPFNCRPCFTFHLTWLLSVLTAAAYESLTILLIGVAMAFILFLIVKFIDNKKITK
ncbi:hypothetical protein JGH11_10340 [Dysgonomonas sp. Marseille-P4677]|uniref:hypothetical protein n=1 Tax=Dysgonomonas sp. Marseille-P4677 TaxID=2364790 RepID=UPI001911B124|nr:hypothetical protein [Dysgonomonas sp. Marseille-P4677]MBK5721269.1 hypothetical protein [Dysgonomonas sp. Marseille-P4677]